MKPSNLVRGTVSVPILFVLLAIISFLVPPEPAVAETTLLYEDFETGEIPEGWTLITQSVGPDWQVTGSRANLSSFSTVAFAGPPGGVKEIWLITPQLLSPTAPSLELRFYESADFWTDFGGLHEILISKANPVVGDFTLILQMTRFDHSLELPGSLSKSA